MSNTMSLGALSVLLLCGYVAADSGDDLSNNLISDLGPLISLFGERVTMQFMSQAMGWADNFILAMAPIGIITIIVSAIRVGGPSLLKAIIGRARENLAVAEVDLMSSTSEEVCELWNGREVVRCMGSAPITEFICLLPEDSGTLKPDSSLEVRTAYLVGKDTDTSIAGDIKQVPPEKIEFLSDLRKVCCLDECAVSDSDKFSPSKLNIIILRNMSDNAAPNISLNSHTCIKPWELRTAAIFGTLLQLGVLVYGGCITYHPSLRFPKDDAHVAAYAFPCTAIGTFVLNCGLLLCAHVVESKTKEKTYQPCNGRQARMVWLQQRKTVSDQFFDSCAIFPEAKSEIITMSRRKEQSSKGPAISKESQTYGGKSWPNVYHKLTMLELKTIFGSIIALCGYVVQFVGLRGMHWSASAVQLGAVLVMVVIRAVIRRRFAKTPKYSKLVPGHELEWFVMMLMEHPDMSEWSKIDTHSNVKSVGAWNVATGWKKGPRDTKPAGKPLESSKAQKSKAHSAVMIRRDLSRLAAWRGPASTEAIALARAIQATLNTLFDSSHPEPFVWDLQVEYGSGKNVQMVQIQFKKQGGEDWKVQADEMESMLSLWLYSAHEKEESEQNTARNISSAQSKVAPPDNDTWLLATGSPEKPALRLLGPYSKALHRDLWWWMPDEVFHVLIVKEIGAEDSAILKADDHRIVGFGLDSADTSSNSKSEIQFASSELGMLDFNQKETDLTEATKNKTALAAKSLSSLSWLYAQDLFSKFMETAADKLKAPIKGKTYIRGDDTKIPNAWKSHKLLNDQLTRIAQEVQQTGLGNLEDIYLSIVPPLSEKNKLPPADAIIELIQQEARQHEQLGHWREVGDFYRWLFQVGKTFQKSEKWSQEPTAFITQVTAILLDLLRRVIGAIRLSRNSRRSGSLNHLKDSLKKVLGITTENSEETPEMLKDFMKLYRLQGFGWTWDDELFKGGRSDPSRDHDEDGRSYDENLINLALDFENKCITMSSPGSGSLLSASKIETRDRYGRTVFHYAAAHNRRALFYYFQVLSRDKDSRHFLTTLDSRDLLRWTPLHYAAQRGNSVAVANLLILRANLNASDLAGWTPLHYSCWNGNTQIARYLIKEGADINAQGRDGAMPLHCAAMNGHSEAIQLLIAARAIVDVVDAVGNAPLSYAIHRGHADAIKALWSKSDKNPRGLMRGSPLHEALVSGAEDTVIGTIKCLIDLGADKNAKDSSDHTPLHLAIERRAEAASQLLIKAGADKEAKGRFGETPLHFAARDDSESTAKLLIAEGADKEAKDSYGRTPLHLAASCNSIDCAKVMINAGALIDARSEDGQTPLHMAASGRSNDVAMLLVSKGADKEAKDCEGQTPRSIAMEGDNEEIKKILNIS